jgi:uncharacterized membrane protein
MKRGWLDRLRALGGDDRALWAALLATCALGWLFKGHCLAGGWSGGEQYATGCYSDVVPFWLGRGVKAGLFPYLEAPLEYPVLTGAQIWVEGAAARLLFGARANDAAFLGVVTIANALIAAGVLRLMQRAGVARRRLWLWALAPPLVLYLGHNWDLAAVALAVAALVLAREGRLAGAAVLAALGAAAKLFPVVLLPIIGLMALTAPAPGWSRRVTQAATVSAAALGAWTAVNLPAALSAFDAWSAFYRFSQERAGTAAASWDVLAGLGWFTWTEQRNLYAALLFVGGGAALLALGWRRHRSHPWVLATPLLAWFLLTNKVWSPQFDLWLYPLMLMTAPRLGPVALFVLGDLACYFAEFWWFNGADGHWPAATTGDIALAAGLRAAALLWLIADHLRRPAPAWTVAAGVRRESPNA